MNDASDACRHLEAVALLAGRLSPHDIAIFEHHFDYLASGSWTIVAGSRKRTLEFSWDGCERCLSCLSIAHCAQHSSREQKWGAPELRSLSESERTDPLRVVESEILKRLLTEPSSRANSHQPSR